MWTEWLDRLLLGGHIIALGVAVFATAAMVNRFNPQNRVHIGRTVLTYIGGALAFLLNAAAQATGSAFWIPITGLAADLGAGLTLVSLFALVIIDVVLAVAGIEVAAIIFDILIGLGYVAVTLAVISNHGVDVSSLLAVSGVAAGVLTISMQATLGNIVGGVALQLDGSLKLGDWVQLENGRQGKVEEIRWRHVVLETRDWGSIVVPNAMLLQQSFMILGKRENKPIQHRYWVNFLVDYRHSPSEVTRIVQEALRSAPIPNVAADPPPDCVCLDLAAPGRDAMALYSVRYWLVDLNADEPTNSAIRGRIFSSLKRAGISLAKPAQTVFHAPREEDDDADALKKKHDKAVAALHSVALFQPLHEDEIHELGQRLVAAPFAAGEVITRQGAVAHWLYILCRGSAEVRLQADGVERVVTRIEAPDIFGEMSLMTGEPRKASVVALNDVICYRLDREAFDRILRGRPEIAQGLSDKLAKRHVELMAVGEKLDADARAAREKRAQIDILNRIQKFFGLET